MKSIGSKLIIYFSILILLIYTGVGVFSYKTTSDAVISEAEKVLIQKAEDVGEIIEERVASRFIFLEGIASRDRITNQENSIEDKLSLLKEEAKEEGYLRMGIADLDGTVYFTEETKEMGLVSNISQRDYFKEALQGKWGMMEPKESIVSEDKGKLIMVFSVPIKKSDKIIGVLVAIADAKFLSRTVNQISYGEQGYVFVVNEQGTIIAHKNEEYVLNRLNIIEKSKTDSTLVPLAGQMKRMINKESGFSEYKDAGEENYLGFCPIDDMKWSVAVVAPKSEILSVLPELERSIVIITLFSLLLGIIVTFFIGKYITKPIIWSAAYAEKMADLDVSESINEKLKARKDEIGRLANAFQLAADNIRNFIMKVEFSSEQVANASEELKATSENSTQASEHIAISAGDVSKNASQQLNEVLNMTSAMEEISSSIQEVSSNAQDINLLSSNVCDKAALGKEEMNKVIVQMNNIGESTNEVQNSLKEITNSSNKINGIINLINNISEQTNLLALNAAIEAARAGEAGKGFTIVADEVRKLAEETRKATEEINDLISKNKSNIDYANTTVEKSVNEVEKGIDVVKISEKTFGDIAASIGQVNMKIETIAESINQVAEGGKEVVYSTNTIEETSKDVAAQIQNISSATEEQSASMEEIAASSDSLAQLALELEKNINEFNI